MFYRALPHVSFCTNFRDYRAILCGRLKWSVHRVSLWYPATSNQTHPRNSPLHTELHRAETHLSAYVTSHIGNQMSQQSQPLGQSMSVSTIDQILAIQPYCWQIIKRLLAWYYSQFLRPTGDSYARMIQFTKLRFLGFSYRWIVHTFFYIRQEKCKPQH